jgi:hypothetical protein
LYVTARARVRVIGTVIVRAMMLLMMGDGGCVGECACSETCDGECDGVGDGEGEGVGEVGGSGECAHSGTGDVHGLCVMVMLL